MNNPALKRTAQDARVKQDATLSSRRTTQKAKRQLAIINAALQVFSKVGFAAAKIDDVAEAAGISKGTLYLYFDSKEALFEGMVIAKIIPVFEEAKEIPAQMSGSAEEILRALMKFFYTKILSNERRQIMRLIMAEGPNFPNLTAFYYDTILSRGKTMIHGVLNYGVQTGEFRKLKSHGLHQNVMAGAIAASMWKLVFDQHEPIDLDAYSETHIDLLLGGLRSSST